MTCARCLQRGDEFSIGPAALRLRRREIDEESGASDMIVRRRDEITRFLPAHFGASALFVAEKYLRLPVDLSRIDAERNGDKQRDDGHQDRSNKQRNDSVPILPKAGGNPLGAE